jgi:hypothetical protein
MSMTAQDFVAKWRRVDLAERSAVQQHFLDLCALVGHPPQVDEAVFAAYGWLADLSDDEILARLALNLERAAGQDAAEGDRELAPEE